MLVKRKMIFFDYKSAQKARANKTLTTLINWAHTHASISFVNQLHHEGFKNRNDKGIKKEN